MVIIFLIVMVIGLLALANDPNDDNWANYDEDDYYGGWNNED